MRRLTLAIERLVAPRLIDGRVDLRERDVVLGGPARRFLTLRADQERRVRALHQRRRRRRLLPDRPVLPRWTKFSSAHTRRMMSKDSRNISRDCCWLMPKASNS